MARSAAKTQLERFNHVVIGRRRQHRLDIKLVLGNLTDVDARAYVLGVFRDVTPSGPARTIDKLLDGAITEFTTRRMFSGTVGEIFMMPAGRHTLRADTILFAGLGLFDIFSDEVQQLVAENVIRTLIRTRVEEFATVFFGAATGRGTRDSLGNMLKGFLRGLRDTDTDHRFRCITLCEIDPHRFAEMKSELYRLLSTPLFDDFEVTLDEKVLENAEAQKHRDSKAQRQKEDPVYLLVRQESAGSNGTVSWRSSVLTAGDKATVVTTVKNVNLEALDGHLSKLQFASSFNLGDMNTFGELLGRMVLPNDVVRLLRTMQNRHLVIVHDAEASRIPWETLAIRRGAQHWVPAIENGLSRRYTAGNLSIAKWLERRRLEKTLSVLLVINPTGDLPAAEAEGRRIQEIARKHTLVSLRVVQGAAATKRALLGLFQSGDFDLVHYAGHAFFDPMSPSRSGVFCADGQVLSGRELAGLGNLPSLVFFNACEAGRIRKREKSDIRQRVEVSAGLAEAFLRGGVANYVGTYWPVNDVAASLFASTFYAELLKGASVGNALLAGRCEVQRAGSIDWADYIHYGDFHFALKRGL